MMAAKLESELARARSDKHFVGWAIARFSIDRKMSRADLLGHLRVTEETAPPLELRMLPRPASFQRELQRLVREYKSSPRWLGAVCRHGMIAAGEFAATDPVKLADTIGVTPRRIYQMRGVRKLKPRMTDTDRAAIRELLPKHSRREIVKLTGRCRKVVDAVALAK